ncbi:hypothetical protein EB354_06810 [Chryseobacterium balustinum]|nr:hypothetical protein EB354_06810 [Chryseobacterium balustinum]
MILNYCFFSRNFKVNSPKKVQIISIEIMNLEEIIMGILKASDEQIASNRWNKNAFSRLRIAKITVVFCV